MSEILGDTGKKVSGGRALLLCICHECGNNFEIQRRRFSQLKPCLTCLRKKQNSYKPLYVKIEELEHKLEMAKEALVRILSSEVLKEAPFYSYSEAILLGMEVLEKLK